jgi:hypothetical protein
LCWNRSILTNKTIAPNGPDMTIAGKVTNTAQMRDIAAPDTLDLPKIMCRKFVTSTDTLQSKQIHTEAQESTRRSVYNILISLLHGAESFCRS